MVPVSVGEVSLNLSQLILCEDDGRGMVVTWSVWCRQGERERLCEEQASCANRPWEAGREAG
jgi:hypothetical protein